MFFWTVSIAGGIVVLYVFGRYNLSSVMRDWEMVLTPAGRRAVRQLQEHVDLDAAMVDCAYRGASRARAREDAAEAFRLLELAFSVLSEATPDRLRRLRGMAVCCRMAQVMVPLPPLTPSGFRLKQVATLAGLGGLIHHVLVGTAERFRFRLKLLGFGFRLVRMSLGRSVASARKDPACQAAWENFAGSAADFRQLDVEHVGAFRALVTSLDAEERAPLRDREGTVVP